MTLEEARSRAQRLADRTGQPGVLFRSGIAGWEVWHTLDAAKWLDETGEVALPRTVEDPRAMERQLRHHASRLRGPARLKLLEAAMTMRAFGALARMGLSNAVWLLPQRGADAVVTRAVGHYGKRTLNADR
jgi:hypothetical protein